MSRVLNPDKTKDLRRKLRSNQTDAEKILWSHLRNRKLKGYKFYRQYGVDNYVVDFYCPSCKLVIELDGGQHNEENLEMLDDLRTVKIQKLGSKVIRFWNNEVIENTEGVLKVINEYLESNSPQPPLHLKRGR